MKSSSSYFTTLINQRGLLSSMGRPRFLTNIADSSWVPPPGLEGVILNDVKALQDAVLPKGYQHIRKREHVDAKSTALGYDRYAAIHKDLGIETDLAYGCPNCTKIVIGPPKVQENAYYCHSCDEKLYFT